MDMPFNVLSDLHFASYAAIKSGNVVIFSILRDLMPSLQLDWCVYSKNEGHIRFAGRPGESEYASNVVIFSILRDLMHSIELD